LAIAQDSAINFGIGGTSGAGLTFAGAAGTGLLEFTGASSGLNYTDSSRGGILSSVGQNVNFGSSGTTTLTGVVNTAGVISGATTTAPFGTLSSEAGTVIIAPSAANTVADNWGTTNITGGTLQIGNGGAFANTTAGSALTYMGLLGSTASTATTPAPISINNASLTFDVSNNLTVANLITQGSTASNINQNGSGILTLSAANSYTGTTTINAGILQVTNVGALGGGAGGTTTKNGTLTINSPGILDLDGTGTASAGVVVGILGGTGTVTNSSATTGWLTVGNANNSASTFTGIIQNGTGAVGLNKLGTGTLTLSGTVANTYSAGTNINAGTVAITADNQLGTGPINFNGGTLQFNNYSSALNLSGASLSLGAATGTAATLTGTIADVSATTKTNLTFAGAGTLALGAANTYTGTTTIKAGELSIGATNNIGTGAITLSGGDLQITGTTITSLGSGTTTVSNLGDTLSWSGSSGLDIATAANDVSVKGNITGLSTFTKLGAGTLSLTSANQLGVGSSEGVTVSAGTRPEWQQRSSRRPLRLRQHDRQ
jgi:autotransporter-associated beta strand protein